MVNAKVFYKAVTYQLSGRSEKDPQLFSVVSVFGLRVCVCVCLCVCVCVFSLSRFFFGG